MNATVLDCLFLAVTVLVFGCSHELSREDRLGGAASAGNIAEIKRLLGEGVDVNCRIHSNVAGTPLYYAALFRQPEAVEVLLAAGADPNIANTRGETPLLASIGAPGEDTGRVIRALLPFFRS